MLSLQRGLIRATPQLAPPRVYPAPALRRLFRIVGISKGARLRREQRDSTLSEVAAAREAADKARLEFLAYKKQRQDEQKQRLEEQKQRRLEEEKQRRKQDPTTKEQSSVASLAWSSVAPQLEPKRVLARQAYQADPLDKSPKTSWRPNSYWYRDFGDSSADPTPPPSETASSSHGTRQPETPHPPAEASIGTAERSSDSKSPKRARFSSPPEPSPVASRLSPLERFIATAFADKKNFQPKAHERQGRPRWPKQKGWSDPTLKDPWGNASLLVGPEILEDQPVDKASGSVEQQLQQGAATPPTPPSQPPVPIHTAISTKIFPLPQDRFPALAVTGEHFAGRSPALFLVPQRSRVEEALELEVLNRPDYNKPTSLIMRSHAQVLFSPTADTPGACLLLHFPDRRYIIGRVSEGGQRLMTQHRISLSKVHSIFLTGPTNWETTGGLLGMILTLADVKQESTINMDQQDVQLRTEGRKALARPPLQPLEVHGGKNLMLSLASARRFIYRKGMPLRTIEHEFDRRAPGTTWGRASSSSNSKRDALDFTPDFEDHNIKIWKIPLAAAEPDLEPQPAAAPGPAGDESVEPSPKRHKSYSPPTPTAQVQTVDDKRAERLMLESIVSSMFCGEQLEVLRNTALHDIRKEEPVLVKEDGQFKEYKGPRYTGASEDANIRNIRVYARRHETVAAIRALPPSTPSATSMCYLVKTHTRRGKFNVEAADKLGVVRSDRKFLTQGLNVRGKDGNTVTPEMAMDPPVQGTGFAVIDIRRPGHLDSLEARPEWSNKDVMDGIGAMFWIVDSEALKTVEERQKLATFMQQHSSLQHVMLSEGICVNNLVLTSLAAQQIRMNMIDPERFTVPVHSNVPSLPEHLPEVSSASMTVPIRTGRPGEMFQLAPQTVYRDEEAIPLLDTSRVIRDVKSMWGMLDKADRVAKRVSRPEFVARLSAAQADIPSLDTEIITLGTGSALPSKYRNVSATLVRVPGYGSVLFDCGENTLGQMRRLYGHDGADEVLRDLRAVFISHAHADHHLGSISVLDRWNKVTSEEETLEKRQLGIIATMWFHEWLREYRSVQDFGYERLLPVILAGSYVPNTPCDLRCRADEPLTWEPGADIKFAIPGEDFALRMGLQKIEACFVDHCSGAVAGAVTFPSGLKVAYSGDCRPSHEFAWGCGKGAHLLIHESTFESELRDEAKAKKHSTMAEALSIAKKMGAQRVMLTHFSQRYPKIPVINEDDLTFHGSGSRSGTSSPEEAASGDEAGQAGQGQRPKAKRMSVLFGFDGMRVKLGDFRKAEAYLPALRRLYSLHEDLLLAPWMEEHEPWDLQMEPPPPPVRMAETPKQKKDVTSEPPPREPVAMASGDQGWNLLEEASQDTARVTSAIKGAKRKKKADASF